MIEKPNSLMKFCNMVAKHYVIGRALKVNFTKEMRHLFDEWQDEDRFPTLLGFPRGGAYYLARCR